MKRLIKFLLFTLLALFFFSLGMMAYHNESIRNRVLSLQKISEISLEKYRLGSNAEPPTFQLIIPDSSRITLEECQRNAIRDGILRDENKIDVKAKVVFNRDTLNIKMRLKGDYSDHWSGNKWSYRIKIRGDRRLLGMKSFSIQDPETRNNLSEWYFHTLLKSEGLIGLRYQFIEVIENGTSKGIYALEESFDKQLIENCDRREAPILKFDESILIDFMGINKDQTYSQSNLYKIAKIDVFKSKRTLKNPSLYYSYQKGKALLNGLRENSLALNDAIDVDKAARLFALADLTSGHHGLRWKNIRFYFNPVIGKLELVGFDSNSGYPIEDIYYNKWNNGQLGSFDVGAWKDVFFSDEAFIQSYFHYLKKYSDPKFLDTFHATTSKERNTFLSYIYKDFSRYEFHIENYVANAALIREKITAYEKGREGISTPYLVSAISKKPISLNATNLHLQFRNNSHRKLILLGIYNKGKQQIGSSITSTVSHRKNGQFATPTDIKFNLNSALDSLGISIKRSGNHYVYRGLKIGYKFEGQNDTLFSKIESYQIPTPSLDAIDLTSLNGCIIDSLNKTITLNHPFYSFSSSLITPLGYGFNCKAGTQIELRKGAHIIVNGPLILRGMADKIIKIKSPDSTGTVLIYQSESCSQLNHVNFSGLSGAETFQHLISGGVNFYEADVVMENVKFSLNNSEDALNTVRCNFELNNCVFQTIKSDAFDGDFCTGDINSCRFENVGNDAIDFSGSTISINSVSITDVGDKGISAGERSKITATSVNMNNGELGLVSKDGSLLNVDQVTTNNVKIPYAVFTKKEEFGPAEINLTSFKSENFEEPNLIEYGSLATENSVLKKANQRQVTAILYGKQYGKSSH